MTIDAKTSATRFTSPKSGRSDAIAFRDGASTVVGATAFSRVFGSAGARQVDAQRTPITANVAKDAIARAYGELTGKPLNVEGQSILTAQWAHETAHGASMYNYNFGGIKGAGPSGLTVAQQTREGYGTSERKITDQFRAYTGIDEGAKDYVRLLLSRYGDAVSAAQRGDSTGFVGGLKQKGYFTGDPVAYERSIKTLARQFGGSTSAGNVETKSAPLTVSLNTDVVSNRTTSNDSGQLRERALLSRMQSELTLLVPPQPVALLDSGYDYSTSSIRLSNGTDGLSVVHALSMADEITRSVLEIAKEDEKLRKLPSMDKSVT